MYPKLEVDMNGIIDNFKKIKSLCDENQVKLSVVTKLFCGNSEIVSALVENGVECICESNIENLIRFQNLNVEKWLIRIPMLSEISKVVQYADASLNSEMVTIRELNCESMKQGKKHKVILMYELGDLREGCSKEELKQIVKECLQLKNIELYGIGVNLSCFGSILPTDENMKEFSSLVKEIEEEFHIHFPIVSGGNSSSFHMLHDKKLPSNINSLRLGEAISYGRVPCFEDEIAGLHHDNFILKAQIVELKEKPSIPIGKRAALNSLGEEAIYVDRGIRKRAIVAIGKQDEKIEGMTPLDDKIFILGGSSDHTILDVSDSDRHYQVGDIIEFKLNYSATLQAMLSHYVKKEIKKY